MGTPARRKVFNVRKLAIVGSHPDTRMDAPWDDPDYDIWVFNEAAQNWAKRWTAVFQMHQPEVYTGFNHVRADHWDWLQQDHGPDKVIYMQAQDDRVPNCRAYPLEAVRRLTPDSMLTSTASMALALGIIHGYDEIHVWGVVLNSNSEYKYQAEGWLYWVGFARGVSYANGRETRIELHSGIKEHFENRTYGFEGDPRLLDLFLERKELLKKEYDAGMIRLRRIEDAINEGFLKFKPEVVRQGVLDIEQAAIDAGAFAGALGEAETYAARGTEFTPRQEIERHMAQAQLDGEPLKALMHNAGGKAEYVWNVWAQTGQNAAANQLRKFIAEKKTHAYDMGARLGIYKENLIYMNEYDARIDAYGGERAIKQAEAV